MCAKKSEALQFKIEDVKSEAIDDISRTMKENGIEEHEFKHPIRSGSQKFKGIKVDPEDEKAPFVKLDRQDNEGLTYEDELEEIDELDADEVLTILYFFEDEYKVS